MSLSKTEKIYVNEFDTAIVRCPGCGRSQLFSLEQFKGVSSAIKVACSCKAVFHGSIDFRRNDRKELTLQGRYFVLPEIKEQGWGEIELKNLSMSGIGFVVHGDHRITKDDMLMVHFTLDDQPHSDIEKSVVVRNVRGNYLGCEFEPPAPNEKALGAYLLT